MIGFVFQQAVSVALSAATFYYFGFVRYAVVALLAFVVVLSVFASNDRKLEASSDGYELPPRHNRVVDLGTRVGLAGWCGAVWPGLAIGALFGWRRDAWK